MVISTKLNIMSSFLGQITAIHPPNKQSDSIAGIISSRISNRATAPFGVDVADVVPVAVPVERGLGTGVDGL